MESVNDTQLDAQIRHQIMVLRLRNGIVTRMLNVLDRADADAIGRLVTRLQRIENRGFDLGPATTERLERVIVAIQNTRAEVVANAGELLTSELEDFLRFELTWQTGLLEGAVSEIGLDVVSPTIARVRAAAFSRPFQTRLLRDWVRDLGANDRRRIRHAIQDGVIEGLTTPQIARSVQNELGTTRRHATTIARTATNHVANAARREVGAANADIIKGVRYVATLDSRTTPICQALDGRIFPVDSGPRPPQHHQCLSGDSFVSAIGGITAASKRRFNGYGFRIVTSSGRELTATPNHPILTRTGWQSAGSLTVGSNVACVVDQARFSVVMDHQDPEAPIQDIASAFLNSSEVRSMPVPTTAKDFHGDGVDGEIAIISTNRFLRDGRQANGIDVLRLYRRRMRDCFLSALGNAASMLLCLTLPPDRRVSGFGQLPSLLGRGSIHSRLLLGAAPPESYPALFEDSFNGPWADAEQFSDAAHADAAGVGFEDIVSIERKFLHTVYNLETESHLYTSNGIINHNCRSTITYVLKGVPGSTGTRASFDGQVPSDLTYDQWLRRQPREFVEGVLGRTRARLYLDGNLSVTRFVDRSGDQYTLAELRRRDPDAFRLAEVS